MSHGFGLHIIARILEYLDDGPWFSFIVFFWKKLCLVRMRNKFIREKYLTSEIKFHGVLIGLWFQWTSSERKQGNQIDGARKILSNFYLYPFFCLG
jgi:hypothetical protein